MKIYNIIPFLVALSFVGLPSELLSIKNEPKSPDRTKKSVHLPRDCPDGKYRCAYKAPDGTVYDSEYTFNGPCCWSWDQLGCFACGNISDLVQQNCDTFIDVNGQLEQANWAYPDGIFGCSQ